MKDILAHIAWYEREMIGMLRAHAVAGSDLWDVSLDARNAAIYEINAGRPLGEVQAEAWASTPS